MEVERAVDVGSSSSSSSSQSSPSSSSSGIAELVADADATGWTSAVGAEVMIGVAELT